MHLQTCINDSLAHDIKHGRPIGRFFVSFVSFPRFVIQ
jgi:hypothetical protein